MDGRLGGGGPRQVGAVLARHGGPVPWWRVVRADGSLPPSHEGEARQAYLEEGTPLRPSGNVDIRPGASGDPSAHPALSAATGPAGQRPRAPPGRSRRAACTSPAPT